MTLGIMHSKFTLFILVFIQLAAFLRASTYCKINTCENRSHTLCKYSRLTPSSNCKKVISIGLTEDEKNRILTLHKTFRDVVYSGWEFRGQPGPQPPSINQTTVEWDQELAAIAQAWALRCDFRKDECRNVNRFNVSQNIALRSVPEGLESKNFNIVDWIIYDWQDEVSNFPQDDTKSYRPNNSTSNYSQMVWENSTKIGCGGIRFYDDDDVKFFLVCNYGAAGNIEGMPVYQTDDKLSAQYITIANFLHKFT